MAAESNFRGVAAGVPLANESLAVYWVVVAGLVIVASRIAWRPEAATKLLSVLGFAVRMSDICYLSSASVRVLDFKTQRKRVVRCVRPHPTTRLNPLE